MIRMSVKSFECMIKYYLLYITIFLLLLYTGACQPPLNENAELDEKVGRGEISGAVIRSEGGLAAIRELSEGAITFWLQAPVQKISVDLSGSTIAGWSITLLNAMPGTALQDSEGVISYSESHYKTSYSIDAELSTGGICNLTFAPDDHDTNGPFSFVMMADVQGAVTQVGDIYNKINQDPSLRFVAFAGDLTENMDKEYKSEYTNFIEKMELLSIPVYSTPGNHDMGDNGPEFWHELFGRVNVHFLFKGVAFTLIDSSSASIEPDVYDWLEDWADDDKSRPHLFFTHYPPIDPIGIRSGSFKSKNEAYKLLAILLEGNVDSTFHGHVHSYYRYTYSGMPAYISGGGGALPEEFDNIGRHFLKVTAGASTGVQSVKAVEVD